MTALVIAMVVGCGDAAAVMPDAAPDDPTPRCKPAMTHSYEDGCTATDGHVMAAQPIDRADAIAFCESQEVAISSCRVQQAAWVACNEQVPAGVRAPSDGCSCAAVYQALLDCVY